MKKVGAYSGRGCVLPGLVAAVEVLCPRGDGRKVFVLCGPVQLEPPGEFGRDLWGQGPFGNPWEPITGGHWL